MREKILNYLEDHYGHPSVGAIQGDTPLLSGGLIDSISALELVDFLEKNFGFEFEPHEVDKDNLDSLDRIIAFVTAKSS
jgi:acyl carrier protein